MEQKRDRRKRSMKICKLDVFKGGIINVWGVEMRKLVVKDPNNTSGPTHSWKTQSLLTFLHLLTLLIVSVSSQCESLALVWLPLLPIQQKTQGSGVQVPSYHTYRGYGFSITVRLRKSTKHHITSSAKNWFAHWLRRENVRLHLEVN